MIIKGTSNNSQRKTDWALPILLVLLGGVLAGTQLTKPSSKQAEQQNSIKMIAGCSAEKVDGDRFVSEGNKFKNANTQSIDKAKTGKHSSLLDAELEGMAFVFENPTPGATYKAQVWRHTTDEANSFMAIKSASGEVIKQTNRSLRFDGNHWGQLELMFTIPIDMETKNLELVVYKNEGAPKTFFDDLTLQRYEISQPVSHSAFKLDTLHAQIDAAGMNHLQEVRKRAFATGIYVKEVTDFVDARILDDERSKKAKMRYKGDWLDHMSHLGESYRIEMNKAESWNGMQTFSVQRPNTRGFLREWIYHEFLKHEDVLTPWYDFIHFQLNENEPKVYAYEEHFTKNLVESQLRREGPILKFDESHFWEGMKRHLHIDRSLAGGEVKNDAYWSAEILPFKANRTANDTVLSKQFEQAKNLMHQYKHNLKPANEIFDVERMAKMVAISDICRAHHSLTWHNQRFYYNPVINLLEPIGFDGYSEIDPDYANILYTDHVFNPDYFEYEPLFKTFEDPEFLKAYFRNYTRMADPEYLKPLLAQWEEGIVAREMFIKTAQENYSYDRDEILRKANKIQKEIWPFDNSLQVYLEENLGDSIKLKLLNTHTVPLEVSISERIKRDLIVFPSRTEGEPEYYNLTVSRGVKELKFSLPGLEKNKTARISPFASAQNSSARQSLRTINELLIEQDNYLTLAGKEITIETPLRINGSKKLVVEKGTIVRFKDEGFLLSEAPVEFNGTENEPIIIECLDGKNGSVTVLQAKDRSRISYTTFKNQNTLNYHGWKLTGGVTFYESDVDISNSSFLDNQCEDGLNIIKSDFTVSDSYFENIYSDAFDADFCVGTISGSTFLNTGNDAIDFSTSQIEVIDCSMTRIGDKAISAGEQATVNAKNIQVNNANFAVASKDKSVLTLENIDMKNCETGFAAYQKKPEFGSATIVCSGFEAENIEKLFMIEQGSTFIEN